MTSVLVVGGGGRLGRAILEALASGDAFRAAGSLGRRLPDAPLPGSAPAFLDLETALAADPSAVVLDVSSPDGATERVHRVADARRALVVGVTGLDGAAEAAIAEAAGRIPVVRAPNFSPGVALLVRALAEIARAKGPSWDIAILDRHHRAKRDAPSGTAKLLASVVEGESASFRQGGIVGEHRVFVTGEEEELVLTHRAFSRRVFARGALLAAAFAASARPGLYGMADVLGLA